MSQTVAELTNNAYKELCYNSAGKMIKGEYVSYICLLLNKCGIDVLITDEYNNDVSNAVREFQKTFNLNQTGNLNDATLKGLITQAERMSDYVDDDNYGSNEDDEEHSNSPHYDSFFDDNKHKIHRRNHKDIKIVFGNNSISKTIKDVIMMSVSVEVDTSGNPISEVYEFIARDVVETDEFTDIDNYFNSDNSTSSNTAYNFSSVGL
jgi:hypothetical protein